MKKITRANFEGLRQRYPVLNKEEMRRYVGGNSTTLYDESDLALLDVYTLDLDINACSAVESDKDDEMEEDVWASDLGISAFSAGGYWYDGSYTGYGYWDIDGGYLDEVVIYGNKPNNDYYSGDSSYPGWGDDSYWGGYSYWSYDSGYGYDGDPFTQVDNGQCLVASILNACSMLGMAVTEKEIKQKLSRYWDKNVKRYIISESQVKSVLDEYFNVQTTSSLGKMNSHLAQNKPVLARIIVESKEVNGVEYVQQHAVVITGINSDSYRYYDPVGGGYKNCALTDFKYSALYMLNNK